MRRFFLIFGLIFCLQGAAQSLKAKDAFEIYGDVFQFLPLAAAGYALIEEDYAGLGYLALGFGSTMAVTYASKLSFAQIAKKHPSAAKISQRPNNGSFDGFPSGHTASAFSAAGFLQKRYGWRLGVPTAVLAALVGVSRVNAKRHTTTQVIVGAALGYGLSYFLANERDVAVGVKLETAPAPKGETQEIYGVSLSYKF